MANQSYGDLLDFFQNTEDKPLTGTYYEFKPFTPEDVGIPFSYDIIDDKSFLYNNVLNALNAELKTQTIKTNERCGFKVNGYCVTQDGDLWQVQSVVERVVAPNTKQALRDQVQTLETEYVVRLIGVNNPWGFK